MRSSLVALFLLLGIVFPVEGQELRNLRINGFGGWSYGRTDQNRFLGYEPNGEFTKSQFALKATGTGIPGVQINAQVFFRTGRDGSVARLDYAFADWQLSNAMHLRFGKAKHPFGIYSEVAGLGTARPFLNLPQSVYGPIGLVSRSYNGIGIQGDLALGDGWSLVYDVYGGGIDFDNDESELELLTTNVLNPDDVAGLSESEDVIGARLQLGLPIDGLRVGASFYSGRPDFPEDRDPERYWTWGFQGEYVIDRTWIRAEYLRQWDRIPTTEDDQTAYYIEAAQFLTDEIQVAATYNFLQVNAVLNDFPNIPDDLTNNREYSFGLNYWVHPEFVIKSSVHFARGNLLAEFEDSSNFLTTLLLGRSPRPTTRLLQFGAQFSF